MVWGVEERRWKGDNWQEVKVPGMDGGGVTIIIYIIYMNTSNVYN